MRLSSYPSLSAALVALFIVLGSQGCSSPSEKIVRAYLGAKTWQEQVKFVRDPDRVKPLMESYYTGSEFMPKRIARTQEKRLDSTSSTVQVDFENGKSTLLYVVQTKAGPKVDFEFETGFYGMTWPEFETQVITTPQKFCVRAELDDYYNNEFRGLESTHWSFSLEPMRGSAFMHGYIKKTSEEGKLMFNTTKLGGHAFFLVTLARTGRSGPSDGVVRIDSVLQEGCAEPYVSANATAQAAAAN